MEKSCIVCGNTYISKMGIRQYCSANCRKIAWRLLNREKYLAQVKRSEEKLRLSRPNVSLPTLVCPICNAEFKRNRYHPEQKCCSYSCSVKLYRKNNPEKVALWKKNDKVKHKEQYKERDAKYKDLLRYSGNRIIALRRDNYTCTECHKPDPEVELVVHHKDFSGQSKKPNNRIENLTTLCRSCHIRLHLLNK
jgi:5-methylcytosine-specific restriction endonuclease McrA